MVRKGICDNSGRGLMGLLLIMIVIMIMEDLLGKEMGEEKRSGRLLFD